MSLGFKVRRYGYTFQALTLAFAGVILGAWFADNREPRRSISGRVVNEHVQPGDVAQIQWEFEVTRDCPGYATRRLIGSNGEVFELPDATIARLDIDDDHLPSLRRVEVQVPINSGIEPGTAHYDITAFYRCNPLQRIAPLQLHFPPIPIAVVDRGRSSL